MSNHTNRPNVLLIISDQHHAGRMGCAGDPIIQTPHLDALASRGVRFDTAYCPYPMCCPSRMAFMTAREPHEIGVYGNAQELRSDIPTFAHAAEASGYDAILAGRMHFVGQDQRHGFRQRIIGDCSPTGWIQHSYRLGHVLGDLTDTPGLDVRGVQKSGPGHTGYMSYDEKVTQTTCDWLENRAQSPETDPFFMVVGYVTPHCPFVCYEDDFNYYASKISIDDLPDDAPPLHPVNDAFRKRAKLSPPPSKIDQWRARVAYYGLTTFTDRCVGQVLASLEASGQADNTIVIYTSDHGESHGEQGLWWKCSFYDGSARIPLIISDPRNSRQGAVSRSPVNLIDVGPTALDLVHAEPIPNASGRSLRQELENEDDQVDQDRLTFSQNIPITNNIVPSTPSRMVRSRRFKYNYYHSFESELFDMVADPNETTNLANDPAYAKIKKQLHAAAMEGWDPERIAQERAEAGPRGAMIRKWVERVNPGDQDEPWYGDRTLQNDFSPVTPDDYKS